MPIRVLIVVDHRVIRQGMKMSLALDAEFEVAGEARNREQALVMVENIFRDAVLMSQLMPVMDGMTMIQAIRKNHPDTKGIALTNVLEDSL